MNDSIKTNANQYFEFININETFIWYSGGSYEIQWETIDTNIISAKIELHNQTGKLMDLTNNFENHGLVYLSLGYYNNPVIESGNGYFLKIFNTYNTSQFDASDTFTFQREWVRFNSEMEDNFYREGYYFEISIGFNVEGTVTLDLYHLGEYVMTYHTDTGPIGSRLVSFLWADVDDTYNYTLRLAFGVNEYIETKQFAIRGLATIENVTITDLDITTSNFEVEANGTLRITWDSVGDIKNMTIYYYKQGIKYYIYDGNDNPGEIEWKAPLEPQIIIPTFSSLVHGSFPLPIVIEVIRILNTATSETTPTQTSTTSTPSSNSFSETSEDKGDLNILEKLPGPSFAIIFVVVAMSITRKWLKKH